MSKIPQGDWDAIAARYQGGESISKIARSYGCTPPAIHYILKRCRQRLTGILGQPSTSAGPTLSPTGLPRANATEPTLAPRDEKYDAAGGAASLANTNTPLNARATPQRREKLLTPMTGPVLVRTRASEPAVTTEPSAPPTRTTIAIPAAPPFLEVRDASPSPNRHGAVPPGVFPGLDNELHLRAEAAIALFRSSFDEALAEGSPGVRERLRQAASDLMRVAARTTIVLDRLNATTEQSARAHNYPRSAHAGEDFGKPG